jgi:hypothetical protein
MPSLRKIAPFPLLAVNRPREAVLQLSFDDKA